MSLIDLIMLCPKILGAKFLNRKFPLAVSWAITYDCNSRCEYCHLPELKLNELNTKEILSIMDQLNQLGTKVIVFTGGESLLRRDIGEIIKHSKSYRIMTILNSNGILIPDKLNDVRGVDILKISLDGPRGVNDTIRGEGCYDDAINAIVLAKESGINVEVTTVISSINASYIKEILDIGKKLRVPISFQPATHSVLGRNLKNPIAPTHEEYINVVKFLINEKRMGCKIIKNSLSSLIHLQKWPKTTKISCAAGLLSCRIEPDGKLFSCGWTSVFDDKDAISLRKTSLNLAFQQAKRKIGCDNCWSNAAIEYNLLTSFNPIAVFEFLKGRLNQ